MKAYAWRYVLGLGLGLFTVCLLVPGTIGESYLLPAAGAGSVFCVLAGIRVHRPGDPLGWYLLALGMAASLGGDLLARLEGIPPHGPSPHLSAATLTYLAGDLCLFAATIRIGREPGRARRREDEADAAIITLGALAISWYFLMGSYAGNASLSPGGRLALLSDPVAGTILVFLVLRSLVFGAVDRPFRPILATGLLLVAASGFGEGLAAVHGFPSRPAVAGLLLAYVLIGVAALHPSIAEVSIVEPKPVPNVYRREPNGMGRMPAVAFAGFVPPSILLIASCLDASVGVPVMAGLCLAVFALIYLRMMWLIGRITGQTNEIEVHARALEASHRQRDALETDLRHLAFHDELTGLANRVLLHDRVEHALASAPRSGRSVALCFGDLDGFKTVNDTLGHHVGDGVLVRASRLLSSIVRPGDTVARIGGDEFAVLMVDIERPDVAVDFADRIVSVLRDAPDFEGNAIALSMSVGVAYGQVGTSTEQLLGEADAAMYEAKQRGKNCVAVFQPSMRSRMVERLDMTTGFRWALGRSEFFLEYQPILSLPDRELRGFEALVRWNHPTLGHVNPLRFIPVAEETGFIVPLGRWVLVEACEQVAAWASRPGAEVSLSVNLSQRQLLSPQLVDEVRTALTLTGLDPRRLIFDVAESVLMKEPEETIRALAELRAIGTRVAVDDFGAGRSSLSHLRRFPIDILKLDKSFVDPLTDTDATASAMVAAIIGLAGQLGLEVVAEGIEHESQVRRLVDLGIGHGQGFLLARPLDRTQAEDLLAGSPGNAVVG